MSSGELPDDFIMVLTGYSCSPISVETHAGEIAAAIANLLY